MLEMPESYGLVDPIMFMGELYDAIAYDMEGNQIVSWR